MNTSTLAFLINVGVIVRTVASDLGSTNRYDVTEPINGYAWRGMFGYPPVLTITEMYEDTNGMLMWTAHLSYEATGRVKAATEINVVQHPYRRPKHQFRPNGPPPSSEPADR